MFSGTAIKLMVLPHAFSSNIRGSMKAEFKVKPFIETTH